MNKSAKLTHGDFAKIFWVTRGDYEWPTFRDNSGATIEPFTSYLDYLLLSLEQNHTPKKAANSTVEAATYALLELIRFLFKNNLKISRFDDAMLTDLRQTIYKSVENNIISRGSPTAAKRTTNVKLRQVYHFLQWGQANRVLPHDSIGWSANCRVRSTLPESVTRGSPSDLQSKRLYPLLFRSVGEKGGLRDGQHWATDEEIAQMEEYFWRTNDYEVAVRNILFLRIEAHSAFRNESTNSLLIEQFSDAATKNRDSDVYRISPPKQKFDRDFDFSLEWPLVDRIREYIRFNRPELLKISGGDEKRTEGRLFISSRTGAPLTDRAVGEILSDAFRAIGAPKGAGGHSLRRYRAVVQCKIVIARMRDYGLPPDRETVTREIMDLLGHTTEEAGRAYDRVMSGYKFSSKESELLRLSNKFQLELDSTRSKTAKLISQIPKEILQTLEIPQGLEMFCEHH